MHYLRHKMSRTEKERAINVYFLSITCMSDDVLNLVPPSQTSLDIQHRVPIAVVTTDVFSCICLLIPKSATNNFPVASMINKRQKDIITHNLLHHTCNEEHLWYVLLPGGGGHSTFFQVGVCGPDFRSVGLAN